MIKINLLPWRQTERAERKKEFFIALGGCAAVAALILAPVYLTINTMIQNQQSLNSYLEKEIEKLDGQLEQIKDLKQQRDQLLARMMIIQTLQQDRSRIVHIFDEFVQIIPAGIYFNSIEKKDIKFIVKGVSDSNEAVSKLMRSIEKSQWLTLPILKQINTLTKDGVRSSDFELDMEMKVPKIEKAAGEEF